MKLWISKSIVALLLVTTVAANAALYNATFNYSGSSYSIPDGSQAGVYSQITVSGMNPTLSDITVTLNLSGGWNGDLHAYLSHNGALVPLLNRVGLSSSNPFGAAGAGMNVTLSDAGLNNIHAAGDNILSGTWRADGQTISPTSLPESFNASGGSITLDGTFGGMNPNGTWTLFFADVVQNGGGQSQLAGYSLNITAVSEPENVALGCFGGVFLVVSLARWGWRFRGGIHRYQLSELEHAQHAGRRRFGQLEPYVFRCLACVRTGERGARGIWRACVAGVSLGRQIHARAKA
jgi:hypothetical protein